MFSKYLIRDKLSDISEKTVDSDVYQVAVFPVLSFRR